MSRNIYKGPSMLPPTTARRLYAESASRVFDVTADTVRAHVGAGLGIGQAFALARRKYDSLRAEYFAPDRCDAGYATEDAWVESGPRVAYDLLYAELVRIGDARLAETRRQKETSNG